MKNLIKESGIRDINALAKRYPKAEIYFHQDLDGVTTAIAMKKYLEDNGINVVVKGMGNLQSHVEGKKNPIWNLITSVMSSLYELERENILERTEMGRKMYVINGGKLGRKVGTVENRQEFLQKETNQKIISLLDKGKSVRDISGRLGVSTKTIVKVRKYHLC